MQIPDWNPWYDFSWGDTNKCLFTPDRVLATHQRNGSTQVRCSESESFQGFLVSMAGGITEKPAGKLYPRSSLYNLWATSPFPVTVTVYKTLGLGDLVNFRSFLCLTCFVYFPSITGLPPLSKGFDLEKIVRQVCSGIPDCSAGSCGQVWKSESGEMQSWMWPLLRCACGISSAGLHG